MNGLYTRGIRTEIGRRRFLKACTRQLDSFSVKLQFYPIEREIPLKLDTKMKYSKAMINPPEPCRVPRTTFWISEIRVVTFALSVRQTVPLNKLKFCVHTFLTFCKSSYFIIMSRIGHFYLINLLLEKVDSMKKWLPFCSHFEVFLCISDQK